ncbi:phage minor head protein [Aquamicrobium sp.]|uniref:phage head morphogenesis protein n=1 Tax=Aquamicrobium sp. TaxID=1872579 RepID=UPI0025901CCD|nr:phage minor head protein [Aquamicrobium sp.]MCK9549620.1 phage minor head protein [Aquamicrobium sp.]
MAGERLRGGPPPEAVAYLEGKGFKKSFHWQDTWGEEHAFNYTVAKAMEMDVLQALKDATDRAVTEGVPLAQFTKELTPRLQALGWWGRKEMVDPATGEIIQAQLGSPRRLQTIYWANTRSAYAAGQWERAQRTKGALPYLIYELGPSRVHRDHHVAIAGTVLPVDHAFWDTHYPPNGWGCKCRVRAITRFEAQQVGVSEEPDIQWREFRNKRTGEVTRVPVDIDPGWHTNPGKARARTLMRSLSDRIEQADPGHARQAVADLWAGRTPEAYARMPERVQLPVAVAKVAVERLQGTGSVVAVSNRTLSVKSDKHRHVDPARFGLVQELLDSGERIERPDGSHSYWKQIDGNWWMVALRRSAAGFVRVATFFRSSERRRDEMRRVRDAMGE